MIYWNLTSLHIIWENTQLHKSFKTVEGSSRFQVAVFEPHTGSFKASSRLCLCNLCKDEYGSCSLFQSYTPQISPIHTPQTRSSSEQFDQNIGAEREEINSVFKDGSVVALAAPEESFESVWFDKITESIRASTQHMRKIKN